VKSERQDPGGGNLKKKSNFCLTDKTKKMIGAKNKKD
jgi:hypothetical protein